MWGAWLCTFWGHWHSSLSQRWLFSWVGAGQEAVPPCAQLECASPGLQQPQAS